MVVESFEKNKPIHPRLYTVKLVGHSEFDFLFTQFFFIFHLERRDDKMPKSRSKKSSKKTSAPYAVEDKSDPMYVCLLLSFSLCEIFSFTSNASRARYWPIILTPLSNTHTHTHTYTHTHLHSNIHTTGSRPERKTPESEEEFVQKEIFPDSYAGLVT